MASVSFDHPELADDFQNILRTLEKIKSVEEMSLSGGDFKRPKNEEKSIQKFDKSSKRCELYCYILQILSIFIGWILKSSSHFFNILCKFIEKTINESFYEICFELQERYNSSHNLPKIATEFIKNLTAYKVLHLMVIFFLPPIYVAAKILFIFSHFLLSEVPFE